jgi:hypothetical protein
VQPSAGLGVRPGLPKADGRYADGMDAHAPAPAWPDDWVHGPPLPPPTAWGRPGMALLFHLGCAGCVARAVPWLKRLAPHVGDRAVLFAVHTAYGHEVRPRDEVAPQVAHYAAAFAALPFPLALDLDGSWARATGAQGTPHWFVWDAQGRLERSVYGSQENALTRLGYVVEAWGVALPG